MISAIFFAAVGFFGGAYVESTKPDWYVNAKAYFVK